MISKTGSAKKCPHGMLPDFSETLEPRRLLAGVYSSGIVWPAPAVKVSRPVVSVARPTVINNRSKPSFTASPNAVTVTTGKAFIDYNSDGLLNGPDTPLAGVKVYADVNNDSNLSLNETYGTSSADGTFYLANWDVGAPIRQVSPYGYVVTKQTLGTVTATAQNGLFAPDFPETLNAPSGKPMVFSVDATGKLLRIPALPTVGEYVVPISALSRLFVNGTPGDDIFRFDFTNGRPTNLSVLVYGGTHATLDVFEIIAPAEGISNATINTAAFQIGNFTISSNGDVEQLRYFGGAGNDTISLRGTSTPPASITGGGGDDTLTIEDYTYYKPASDLGADGTKMTVNVRTYIEFATDQHLKSLVYARGTADVKMIGSGNVLRVGSFVNDAYGSIDIGDNVMLIDYDDVSPAAGINAQLKRSYSLTWQLGLYSSVAANDVSRTHAVGAAEAATIFNLSGTQTATFLGQPVDATTLVIRSTIYGDANLDHAVNFADFLLLQNNFGLPGIGFGAGNFNYDSTTNFNDFLILQNYFGLFA